MFVILYTPSRLTSILVAAFCTNLDTLQVEKSFVS